MNISVHHAWTRATWIQRQTSADYKRHENETIFLFYVILDSNMVVGKNKRLTKGKKGQKKKM